MTSMVRARQDPVAIPVAIPVPVAIMAADPLLQAGVEFALRTSPDVTVVETRAAVAVLVADTVDDGILRTVRQTRPVLLVVTEIGSAEYLRALDAGVGGVLRRADASAQRLLSSVLAVAGGLGTTPAGEVLDDREKAVLRLLADGHETVEVARMLAYSVRTVTSVVHTITRRLHLRNRAHAVAHALRQGLI